MFNLNSVFKKIFLSATFLTIGFVFFCFYEQWIIFALPGSTAHLQQNNEQNYQKKIVNLIYYKQEKLQKEQVELIIAHDATQTLQTLINAWLCLIEEENLVDKKITADTVTIAPQAKVGIISLNQNPFNTEQQSIHEKLLFIEGLLATVRQLNFGINAVHFLVQQEPLKDYHLDFTQSWPLEGFLE